MYLHRPNKWSNWEKKKLTPDTRRLKHMKA